MKNKQLPPLPNTLKFGGSTGYKQQIVNPYTNMQVQSFPNGGETGGDPEPSTASSSQLLYELMAGDEVKSYADFNALDKSIREVESFGGTKTTNTESSASGPYQYLDDSVSTAINRYYNILKSKDITDGPLMDEYNNMKGKTITDLTDEQQKVMMLSDFIEGPNAPFKSWRAGEVEDFDLWQSGHFASADLTDELKKQNTRNWKNAQTRLSKASKEVIPETAPEEVPRTPAVSSDIPGLPANTYNNGGDTKLNVGVGLNNEFSRGVTNSLNMGTGTNIGSVGQFTGAGQHNMLPNLNTGIPQMPNLTYGQPNAAPQYQAPQQNQITSGVNNLVASNYLKSMVSTPASNMFSSSVSNGVSKTGVGLMNGSGAGAGVTGGVVDTPSVAGGGSKFLEGAGAAALVGGALSGISKPIAAAMDEKYEIQNAGATSMSTFDNSATVSNETSTQMNEDRESRMKNYDMLDSIPIVGGIFAANRMFDDDSTTTLDDNGLKRFTSKYMSLSGWTGKYDKQRKADQDAENAKISTAFNAIKSSEYAGMQAQDTAAAFGNEREMPTNLVPYGGMLQGSGSEIQSIDIPMTHENNKFQGVKIGEDSTGKPNLAEVGEEIYKDFVFTDRF